MKIITVPRKKTWMCIAILLGIAVFLGFFCRDSADAKESGKKYPIYGVNMEEKKIALTFDCAWENSDTDTLIRLLGQNQIPATFFATGDWCERFPEDVKHFAEAGHDIQNHSYGHPHVAKLSEEKLIADTRKCDDVIESLTGKRPTLYRAPYGEYSDRMLTVFEQTLGHKVIQWDTDSVDWSGKSAAEMVESVSKKVRPGSILLFHNNTKNTPAALAQLIPWLKGEGYEFVLVRDLILYDGYTIDHEGRQTPVRDTAAEF